MKFPLFSGTGPACVLGAYLALLLVLSMGLALPSFAATAAESTPDGGQPVPARQDPSAQLPSERDYLDAQVPLVLSVSCLPQRPDEITGAVTRHRPADVRCQRGAGRGGSVAPGTGFCGFQCLRGRNRRWQLAQPDPHTTFPNQMQLMMDGRSVYSLYLAGSTGSVLQTVALEDIERIEVYRGSNSAAYGAHAFLGSVNIVTRDLADTQDVMARVTRGVGEHGAGVED